MRYRIIYLILMCLPLLLCSKKQEEETSSNISQNSKLTSDSKKDPSCQIPVPELNLAITDYRANTLKEDGFSAFTVDLETDDLAFISWNICEKEISYKNFNHFKDETFSKSSKVHCLFPKNKMSCTSFIKTTDVPKNKSYTYVFAACANDGKCGTSLSFQHEHKETEDTTKSTSYENFKKSEELDTEMVSLIAEAVKSLDTVKAGLNPTAQSYANYGTTSFGVCGYYHFFNSTDFDDVESLLQTPPEELKLVDEVKAEPICTFKTGEGSLSLNGDLPVVETGGIVKPGGSEKKDESNVRKALDYLKFGVFLAGPVILAYQGYRYWDDLRTYRNSREMIDVYRKIFGESTKYGFTEKILLERLEKNSITVGAGTFQQKLSKYVSNKKLVKEINEINKILIEDNSYINQGRKKIRSLSDIAVNSISSKLESKALSNSSLIKNGYGASRNKLIVGAIVTAIGVSAYILNLTDETSVEILALSSFLEKIQNIKKKKQQILL